MKANENQTLESGTIIKAVAAECDEATARLEIDPRELALIVRGRIVALKFPNLEREREAAGCMRSRSRHIDELIHDGAPLMKIYGELGTMEELCQNLTAPIPVAGVDDQIRAAFSEFLKLSWDSAEVEGLRTFAKFAKHGDHVSDITISSVKIGDREITRAQVRADMKNWGWSNAALGGYQQNEKTAHANAAVAESRRKQGSAARIVFSGDGRVLAVTQ
jgi:hypothetical protein